MIVLRSVVMYVEGGKVVRKVSVTVCVGGVATAVVVAMISCVEMERVVTTTREV